MAYILALDQGTTSSRAILFDSSGHICRIAQQEFAQIFPQAGWVEHDPDQIWSSQLGVAVDALAGDRASSVAAIGITNQRETTIVWDRSTGKPIYNAIVWQDRRTAGQCDELRRRGVEPDIQKRTGLVLDPYFSGTKLRWILDHVPNAERAAEKGQLAFGTADTWLIWNLTGGAVHATDASNASRTLLFNIHTGDWDDELLKLFRIPRSILPEVRESSGSFGDASHPALPSRIGIRGVAGDQQAALFGQACFSPGVTKNTYGTGCFMLMQTGDKPVASPSRLLTTVAWKTNGKLEYALEGSVFIGGAVVQWLRDGLKIIKDSSEVEALAASVPDSGGVFLVPAFAGLGAPHWDAYARGAMVGITRGTTGGHIARAAIEAIAFQVADLVSAMQADSGIRLEELRVDGGAARNNLLLQFQADLLGVPVIRPGVTETTALGAAYLAGLAAGVFPDRDFIARQWKVERTFEPAMPSARVAEIRGRWSRAVERARNWESA